jgi:hypothetical protein
MPVKVDEVMRDIGDDVRRARRKRLLAQGAAAEYSDPRIYASVDHLLRRAIERRDHDALLVPEIVDGEDSSRLATQLRFASHRATLGAVVVFAKRRILLPAMRWLYEYSLDNFRRQNRLNRIVFACIEELAIENAQLKLRVAALEDSGIAELQDRRIAGMRDGEIAGLQEGSVADRAGNE